MLRLRANTKPKTRIEAENADRSLLSNDSLQAPIGAQARPETGIVDGIDMLRLKPESSAQSYRAAREQNILDAVSLPVNRLAFNRILSLGWQSNEGGLTRQEP